MRDRNKEAVMNEFEERAKKPFGIADKIGYAAGDFANDLTFVIVALFMLKFYTDIMSVPAVLVGILMMLGKFVDAFTDVAMGQIVDRSSYTAKGKFTPWIRRFMGPVAVACFLIFAPYMAGASMGVKVAWMAVTYILWGSVCYTGVNIPYGSMASAMTEDPNQRQQLSTWRNIGATVAQIVIVAVLPLIVYQTDAQGHQVLSGDHMMAAAGVCCVLAVLVYIVCYALSTERVKIETKKEEQKNILQIFGMLFTNRAFVGIMSSALVLLLTQLTWSGMWSYVYPNYFNDKTFMSIGGFVNNIVVLLLATVISKVTSITGKKEIAVVGAAFSAVMLFVTYALQVKSPLVFMILAAVTYVGLALFNLVCWAMIIDVIDDVEIRTGSRNDGTVYSVYSFARKLGQGLATGLTGWLISLVGYSKETAFDPSVTQGIYNLGTLVPAIGFLVMALLLFFIYPLSKKKVLENNAELKKRHAMR